MKDSIKKFMALAMLLSFSLTTPVSSLAMAADGDLLAYSLDYMPEIRGSQPSVISLDTQSGITSKDITVNLSLRDSDIKQVLRMFADKAGLNIIFKGNIEGKVTLDLVNIPLNSAFNMVMTSQNLSYVLKENTLMIVKAGSSASINKSEMAILPVKYINAAQTAHFLNANIYGIKKPGLSNNYIASANPSTNEVIIFGGDNDIRIAKTVIAQLDRKPVVTSFKVNHTTPKQMAEMICTILLPNGGHFIPEYSGAAPITGGAADIYTEAVWGTVTGGASEESSSSDEGSGTIELGAGSIACSSAIKNETKNESKSSSSDDEDDDDAEIVSLETFGITVAYYTQLGTISVTGATPHQLEMIKEYIAENDKRQPQAYVEFSIIELSESGSREFNNEWSFVSKHFNVNFSETSTSMNPYFNNASSSVGNLSYIPGTPSLLYSLRLLMENKKGRVISNPRIVVTNGQESVIDLTEDYVKTVTSQVVQGSYSNVPTVERTYETGDDMGLKISVTPFISPDGYVYLNVKPEYATEKEKVYNINELGQQDLAATLLKKTNLDLKNIRVKDEDTLVIGGMMKETETKNVGKVPFLGDIPGIGTFFRTSSNTKTKSELVILITPKIIYDSDEPSASL